MRKPFFLWTVAMLSMLIAACSQDTVLNDDNPDGVSETTTSYLSVNLVSADDSPSRAAAGYEDGTEAENAITKVRFYFFTETGAPANVKLLGTSYVNYYDWTPGESDVDNPDPNTGDDISSKLKTATIVISTKDGDKLPTQIVAVINPTETTVPSRNLQQLKNVVNDYASSGLTETGSFVMFNSVFADGNGNEVCAVPIENENLATSASDAQARPVNIYVERNVAKVTVTISDEVGLEKTGEYDGYIALKDKNGDPILVNGSQIYLKLNGWDITAETNRGRLGKKIDTDWEYSWWNLNHRSCWAINAKEAVNQYFKYTEINNPLSEALYTNENAENYTNSSNETNDLNRTKVIISGTICDKDRNPLTVVRHLGAHFADKYSTDESKNLLQLKRNILSQLSANGNNYYYQEDGTYKQIAEQHLKIVTVDPDGVESSPANDCYVYAQLSDDGEATAWYAPKADNSDYVTVTNGDINSALKNVDKALVWNTGMTYYFYEIIHKGTGENALKGVVRNHVYKTTVKKIAGLGTPVYNPDQEIRPEKPDPNDHYIAAQINILSWHIVSNEYVLEW